MRSICSSQGDLRRTSYLSSESETSAMDCVGMKIRWASGTFVRHAGEESLVWCPRTDGLTVLQNCRPLLEAVSDEWQEISVIEQSMARSFGCSADVVRADFGLVFNELLDQGFVVCDAADGALKRDFQLWGVETVGGDNLSREGDKDIGDYSPLSEFCSRHKMPLEFHLDLTDACTERCIHCYVPKDKFDFLPVGLAEKALSEFRAMNGLTVHLTGGEAMLHPDFLRICRKCVDLGLNFIVFSNMTLCDENLISALGDLGPQFINVSLYSMRPDEHDSITQVNGSWLRTMDALRMCDRYKVHYRIAIPLLKENRTAIKDVKAFADSCNVRMTANANIVAQADHDCRNLEHACTASELREVFSENENDFNRNWSGVMPDCEARVCDIGESRMYLNAKGNYYPCDSMHEYVLGNVRENTIEEIWAGKKLNYLRSLKNRDFGSCATCDTRPWCMVCPAANFNATGDLFKHHPNTCALAGVVREVYSK